MSAIVFVDTNVLVYAHDADAGAKRDRAAAALRRLRRHSHRQPARRLTALTGS